MSVHTKNDLEKYPNLDSIITHYTKMCLLIQVCKKNVLAYSSSAMKFGSSPRQRYSSQVEDVPQSFLSLKISSVKVDPEAPMNTLDMAHIVLSSIASTYTLREDYIIQN